MIHIIVCGSLLWLTNQHVIQLHFCWFLSGKGRTFFLYCPELLWFSRLIRNSPTSLTEGRKWVFTIWYTPVVYFQESSTQGNPVQVSLSNIVNEVITCSLKEWEKNKHTLPSFFTSSPTTNLSVCCRFISFPHIRSCSCSVCQSPILQACWNIAFWNMCANIWPTQPQDDFINL